MKYFTPKTNELSHWLQGASIHSQAAHPPPLNHYFLFKNNKLNIFLNKYYYDNSILKIFPKYKIGKY
jgi:hypothetical protein